MDKQPKKKPKPRKKKIQLELDNKASNDQPTTSTGKERKKSSSTRSKPKEHEKSEKKKKASSVPLSDPSTSDPKVAPGPSSTAAGSSGQSDSPPRSGSSSPEPNCAICLGKLENKSFTDSCFHMFCFVCLMEWSKVKAECPLCKQTFKSIVHNVRSYDDYDQYHIPRPEDRHDRPPMEFAAPGGLRFRYRTTVTGAPVTDHRYAHLQHRIEQEIEDRLLQRRRRQPANSDFRRRVYTDRLRVVNPATNTRRRVRETSAAFFRENLAQTHRLVPWLNREINALLHGHGTQQAFVLDLIISLISRFDIDSEEFHQHVLPYIGHNTRHFVQEFLMFAKSPYHMAAYDRHVQYEANVEPVSDTDSDQQQGPETGSDSDVIVMSPTPGATVPNQPPPPPSHSSLDPWESSILTANDPSYLGFAPIVRTSGTDDLSQRIDQIVNGYYRFNAPPSASGWDSPTFTTQSTRSSTMRICPIAPPIFHNQPGSIWTPSSSSISAPTTPLMMSLSNPTPPIGSYALCTAPQHTFTLPEAAPSTSVYCPIICSESDTDSDSSAIMIVDYEKPWTERSPVRISSGEDSDVDVMITGSSYITDAVKVEKKKKRKHEHKEKAEPSSSKDDVTKERASKKRRHRSRSRSRTLSSSHRSRSRSHSPLHLRIGRYPDYKHKKFSCTIQRDNTTDKRSHAGRSASSSISSHRARSRSFSMSSTESDPESESKHVSIKSHKSKKSHHSSIQIVEYRKKSSKHKKAKKHKRDNDDESEIQHKGKHKSKKHKRDRDTQYHSSSSSKSKKKKHKKDKHDERRYNIKTSEEHDSKDDPRVPKSSTDKNTDSSETETDVSRQVAVIMKEIEDIQKRNVHDEISNSATSDSESDSDTDVDVEQISHQKLKTKTKNKQKSKKENSSRAVDTEDNTVENVDENEKTNTNVAIDQQKQSRFANPSFDSYGIEFVELPSLGMSGFDEDLDSLTKTLSASSYINPFPTMTDSSVSKSFKKHPHGHKKSSKQTRYSNETSENTSSLIDNHLQDRTTAIVSNVASTYPPRSETIPDLQSNDISSCTDFESEQTLPSFHSFVDRVTDYSSIMKQLEDTSKHQEYKNEAIDVRSAQENVNEQDTSHNLDKIPLTVFEASDSFPVLPAPENLSKAFKSVSKDTECFVDVDTISNSSSNSDIDITAVEPSQNDMFYEMPSYKTRDNSMKVANSDDCIDVVGVSDEDNDDCNITGIYHSPKPGCSGINQRSKFDRHINVTSSDSDSDLEWTGEEHKKINISIDSCEDQSETDLKNEDKSDEIDVVCEDEVVLKDGDTRSRKKNIYINSESDDTDLDYQYDEEEQGVEQDSDKLNVQADESCNETEIDEEVTCNSENDVTSKFYDASDLNESSEQDVKNETSNSEHISDSDNNEEYKCAREDEKQELESESEIYDQDNNDIENAEQAHLEEKFHQTVDQLETKDNTSVIPNEDAQFITNEQYTSDQYTNNITNAPIPNWNSNPQYEFGVSSNESGLEPPRTTSPSYSSANPGTSMYEPISPQYPGGPAYSDAMATLSYPQSPQYMATIYDPRSPADQPPSQYSPFSPRSPVYAPYSSDEEENFAPED